MWEIVRDAPFGQILRFVSNRRFARYPEDEPDFQLPAHYAQAIGCASNSNVAPSTSPNGDPEIARASEKDSSPLRLVTWYSDDDPDNPQNWSAGKKAWVSIVLFVYTFAAYIGSSLYTCGTRDIMRIFGVGEVVASLGLSLYVLGYGIGPMLFSPLSEIPVVGRNWPYIITFFTFVVLCVPMAVVDNLAGVLVLRFLLGFFCSPSLATGGASYGDCYNAVQMPYVIAMWGGGATLAPALGPLVGGYAVQIKGWRWSSWELLWLSAPVMVVMFFSLPETSADNILLKRAQRLRLRTGCMNFRSDSELRQAKMDAWEITMQALVKPWEVNILDPAVLFTTFYTALTYAIFYSFFESFPMVYMDTYGFNLGELGLAFLSVLTGLVVAVVLLCAYLYFIAPKRLAKFGDQVPPEARIWPGLFATFMIPIGLFLFAWTARRSIPWIVSLIGIAISMCGVFTITQCMFIYLPFTYPKYAGSLFAANGFARSCFAAGAILFSIPMFKDLHIWGGVTLLAAFSVACVFGMFALYHYGAALRRRSQFAVS
ncbi:hypothetical protein DTO207G8_2544 [Paecilomyces variotii]|nr:hypothetical protein DTO207G8_2544 [Paecilomyces variotii]